MQSLMPTWGAEGQKGLQCWPLYTGLNIHVKKKRGGVHWFGAYFISHMYTFRNIYCIRATARNQVSRFWIWIYLFVAFLGKGPTTRVNLFSAYSLLNYSITDSSVSISIRLLLCCLEVLGRKQGSGCLVAANRTWWRRSVLTVIIRVSCNQNHCSKENLENLEPTFKLASLATSGAIAYSAFLKPLAANSDWL